MSKIQEAAKAAFANYPATAEVYVTEDGNAFLPEVKSLAILHARQSNLPAPVLVKREEKEVKEEKEEKEVKEAVPTEPKEAEEAEPEEVEEAAPEEAEEAAPEEEVAKPKAKKKGK